MNKVVSTVKCIKVLENSTCSLIPIQKRLLYRSCTLPIALYRYQLWFYKKVLLSYPLRILNHMQHRAAIWILSTFWTSPSFRVKAIASLILINLYLHKLSGRAQLRAQSLPCNHILCFLLESRSSDNCTHYSLSLDSLTHYQRENIKGTIIDMDNRYNKVFSSFDPLNTEFFPGSHIIDVFPSCFFFHPFVKSNDNNLENHTHQLNNVAITSLLDHLHMFIISDSGIKNNVATSIVL